MLHEGDLSKREGRMDEAEVWYQRGLQAFCELFGETHSGLGFVSHKWISLYREMQRDEETDAQLAALQR